jgi:hypothetical protein
VVIGGKIIQCSSHEEAAELFERNLQGTAGEDAADEELASFDLA